MPRNEEHARDEHFWHSVAARYDVEPGPINLENGYFGRMTRSVVEAYKGHIEFINRSNSVHVRQRFETIESLEIRAQLADLLGTHHEAVALTRCASDGLHSLIRNYNALRPGDQLLVSDQEYPSVLGAMRWLARNRGLELIEISHPVPVSFASLVDTYQEAFERYPRLKLMALTYVTHRSGLVMPVQAITTAARHHGVDVILDGAHALGQIDFNLAALGILFAGFNLQKWMGAPLSLGFIYIDPARLEDIDPDMGEDRYPISDIRSRAPYGTPNIPAWMTLPLVFEEHRALGGSAAKGARLNYLRDIWVSAARGMPGIEVLTPDDPRLYCGITSLRFRHEPNQQRMVDRLLTEYNLFTVAREGTAHGNCIRVTPGLANSAEDLKLLARALGELSG
ncbi:aminotransferase class V-fold PLP-dependent enzyme [Pseudomonas gingeri]|uniref:aminotransferase class V-fold PLP-dependent enzyme n=1 Tax=Pseudomonas gingeri TaxID=117681 RepID=UPI0015A1C8F6|nr:aminotransferase class V-fold PLP-dependent enzyme [Pseudomonas gingeri]NWD76751.1 aminotransferase class V-fold PLP-dependent enzyme [Pseudomonas gingeri]